MTEFYGSAGSIFVDARGWGFSETERVVYFRKTLAAPAGAKPRV